MTRAEQYAAQVTYPTAEVTLPTSGWVFTLRRVPVAGWVQAGCLPPYFDEDVRNEWRKAGGMPQVTPSGHGRDEMLRVMRALMSWACVSPKLVVGGDPANDEMDPSLIPAEDQNFLIQAALKGDVPGAVATEDGGQLEVADLRRFREEPQGEKSPPPANDGAVESHAPLEAARAR